jgi:hypothetical protein
MVTFDVSTFTVLMFAAALAGALLAVLPEWRRLMGGGLPIHRHLARRGMIAPAEAALRCALCAGRNICGRRSEPLPDCPNAELFRTGASRTPAVPTA